MTSTERSLLEISAHLKKRNTLWSSRPKFDDLYLNIILLINADNYLK